VREDVIVYFETFSALLEEQLINAVPLPKVDEWQTQMVAADL
jgi:hypothetical protein